MGLFFCYYRRTPKHARLRGYVEGTATAMQWAHAGFVVRIEGAAPGSCGL